MRVAELTHKRGVQLPPEVSLPKPPLVFQKDNHGRLVVEKGGVVIRSSEECKKIPGFCWDVTTNLLLTPSFKPLWPVGHGSFREGKVQACNRREGGRLLLSKNGTATPWAEATPTLMMSWEPSTWHVT